MSAFLITSGTSNSFWEVVPLFDPQFMMTDDSNAFYNAFQQVFPRSKAQKILWSFHVSQFIERKLTCLPVSRNVIRIKKSRLSPFFQSKEVKAVGSMFRSMLTKPLSTAFEDSYASFIKWLSQRNSEMVNVSHFFQPRSSLMFINKRPIVSLFEHMEQYYSDRRN